MWLSESSTTALFALGGVAERNQTSTPFREKAG